MKDGDLWEMFAKAVEKRVPGNTRISKVKGHATQQMVDEGQVEQEQRKATTTPMLGRKEAQHPTS